MVYQQNRRRERIIIFIGGILLISSITGTFLGVYITRNESHGDDTVSNTSTQEEICDDVAIIGAGVGGSYLAWRLRDKNLSVTVYEYSDRVGGRMHSVQFQTIPDINIELGAMRFIPDRHPLMNQTVHELGLSLIDFKPGVGRDPNTLMYIRGKHFKLGEVTLNGPYNLMPNEKLKDDLHLRWSLFYNGTDVSESHFDFRNLTSLLYLKTKDGIDLFKQSQKVAYDTMGLSEDGFKLIQDSFGFHSYTGYISAAAIIPTQNPDTPSRALPVKTVKQGMDQIPKTLMSEFLNASRSNRLKFNHHLKNIQKRDDGTFYIELQKTITNEGRTEDVAQSKTACAKKVVLAVPRTALEEIDWVGLRQDDVSDIIKNAARDSPAAKVFLAYDNAWWRDIKAVTSHVITDRPVRQTYDFGSSMLSNKSILLAVYTDMEDVKFWREVQSFGESYKNCSLTGEICASERVITFVKKFLAEIYNISMEEIPDPIDTAISLWDQYPFGGAWHIWKPGFAWNLVQDRMVQPSTTDDVFISSGMFSPLEGDAWAESALSVAENVLEKVLL